MTHTPTHGFKNKFASTKLQRELEELNDPEHPRTMLSPRCAIERTDACVRTAGEDEMSKMMTGPINPGPIDEGVTSLKGDFIPVEEDFGMLDPSFDGAAMNDEPLVEPVLNEDSEWLKDFL